MQKKIISSYYNTARELRTAIRKDNVGTLIEADDCACYFCRERIEGKVWLLERDDGSATEKFYIDDVCYNQAKSSDFLYDTPVSLN